MDLEVDCDEEELMLLLMLQEEERRNNLGRGFATQCCTGTK